MKRWAIEDFLEVLHPIQGTDRWPTKKNALLSAISWTWRWNMGPDAMAAAFASLMNHAMQIEREQVLKAESHQRTADRRGYANGFKPKTVM